MAHKLADLRAKQDALKAEANGLLDKAEKETEGQPTADQEARLSVIKAELADLDKQMDAEIGKLPAEAIDTKDAENVGTATEADAVKAEERRRAADILEVCVSFNKADRAAAFTASDKSAIEVFRELAGERAKASADNISTANAGGASAPRTTPKASDVYASRQKARNERVTH